MKRESKKDKSEKPGKVIRVDPLIWKHLNQHRKQHETVSSALRRLMGLPPRKGEFSPIQTFYILPESRVVALTIEEARGLAVIHAVRKGKKKTTEKPIEVRQIG